MADNMTVPFGTADELDAAQRTRTAAAPMPTQRTLKNRNNLPVQLAKFAVFNVRFFATFIEEKLAGDTRI